MGRRYSLFSVIYIVIGVLVAFTHGYFANLLSLGGLLSAILAVLLWPLVMLGISLAIAI